MDPLENRVHVDSRERWAPQAKEGTTARLACLEHLVKRENLASPDEMDRKEIKESLLGLTILSSHLE